LGFAVDFKVRSTKMDWADIEQYISSANEHSNSGEHLEAYSRFVEASSLITAGLSSSSFAKDVFKGSSLQDPKVFEALQAIDLCIQSLKCAKDLVQKHFSNSLPHDVQSVTRSHHHSNLPQAQLQFPPTSQSTPAPQLKQSIFTVLRHVPLHTYTSQNTPPSIPKSPLLIISHRLQQKTTGLQNVLVNGNAGGSLSGARKATENVILLKQKHESMARLMEETKSRSIDSFESPILIAEAMTAMFWELFSATRVPDDIQDIATKLHSPQAKGKFNPLQACLDLAGYFSGAIQQNIISQGSPIQRAETLVGWVNVLRDVWYVHHNHMAALGIIGALDADSLKELGETWDYVPRRSRSFITHVSNMLPQVSTLENLQYFANIDDSPSTPFIPWLNYLLQEFARLETVKEQSDFLRRWIIPHQQRKYGFLKDVDPVIGHWLVNLFWKKDADNLADTRGLESKKYSNRREEVDLNGDDFLIPYTNKVENEHDEFDHHSNTTDKYRRHSHHSDYREDTFNDRYKAGHSPVYDSDYNNSYNPRRHPHEHELYHNAPARTFQQSSYYSQRDSFYDYDDYGSHTANTSSFNEEYREGKRTTKMKPLPDPQDHNGRTRKSSDEELNSILDEVDRINFK
jgi:hypothetical protein